MIQVPHFPELSFNERRHIYTLSGVKVPSVTTIMRPLSEAYYGTIDDGILAAASKRGTAVHQAIENWLKFQVDDVPPEHEGYYHAFKKWWAEKTPQLIDAESRVYHKALRYAGTADLPCIIDGKVVCADFKTSAQIVEMLTRVQLEAYARAYSSHGFTFGAKAIVQLQKDGGYEMMWYQSGDNEAFEVFAACLQIYNYKQKYGR